MLSLLVVLAAGASPPQEAPEDYADLFRAAWVLSQAGQLELARIELERCAELAPRSPTVAYHLACLAARSGDPECCLRQLQLAVTWGWLDADVAAWDPDLAALRGDARFERLLARSCAPAACAQRPTWSGDGRLVAVRQTCGAHRPSSLTVYRRDGSPLGAPLELPADADCVAFSPDGTRLAVACGDFVVRLWELPSLRALDELAVERLGFADWIGDVRFFDAGRSLIATTATTWSVQAWNLEEGTRTWTHDLDRGDWVGIRALPDPDRGRVYVGDSHSAATRVLDPTTGELLHDLSRRGIGRLEPIPGSGRLLARENGGLSLVSGGGLRTLVTRFDCADGGSLRVTPSGYFHASSAAAAGVDVAHAYPPGEPRRAR